MSYASSPTLQITMEKQNLINDRTEHRLCFVMNKDLMLAMQTTDVEIFIVYITFVCLERDSFRWDGGIV